MKLERRRLTYQGYYNSTMGYPVPCECVLEYIEPIEAEALELAVERATANMIAAQNRAAELEKALREIASSDSKYSPCDCWCMICIAVKALEEKG